MENTTNQNNEIKMPVSRLSYSSLTQLLRNPLIFKLKHILGVYDTPMGVSGMIGRAVHESLKLYYGGNKDIPVSTNEIEARHQAKDFGLAYLNGHSDSYIDYGKTGSREDMLKGYVQAMDFYFAEEPKYHKILMVEEKMSAELKTLNGDIFPLPATGTPDIIEENQKGEVIIYDNKVVTSFTDYEKEDFIKIVQAMFLFFLYFSVTGVKAKEVRFREIKRTKNRDTDEKGRPVSQIRDWVVPCDHEPYHIIFYNLYRDVCSYLSNNPIFLPNLSDPFDGEQAGLMYSQGLISADMSDVEVMHKVRDVAYTSKKFVASRLEQDENKNLLPEEKIKLRLAEFGIPVEPVDVIDGASVTLYRFKVSAGIRMSTIKKHKDDIARALESKGDVTIIAPIPGTGLVGVEVESAKRKSVKLTDEYLTPNTMTIPIGVNVHGVCVKATLNEMPHLLIAGSTGSGKSILLHSIIHSLTKQMTPDSMRLILIDPKRVELASFKKVPHLDGNVIYEYEDALMALLSLTDEMERRYKLLEDVEKRNIEEYNKGRRKGSRLPYMVVVFDEFADFMIRSNIEEQKGKQKAYSSHSREWLLKEIKKRTKKDFYGDTKASMIEILEELDSKDELRRKDANVELLIVRLAQMARAVGIHLIIATQSPRVDVITGMIKANIPAKIALTTANSTESTIILGQTGAEKLSGKGDMLFLDPSSRGIQRLQGYIVK